MLAHIDSSLIHNRDCESIFVSLFDTRRCKVDLLSKKLPSEGFGHWRAHGVSRATKKHGLRAVFHGGVHSGGNESLSSKTGTSFASGRATKRRVSARGR